MIEDKNKIISMKDDEITRLNMNLAKEEIKIRAKEGSTVILESACQKYSKSKGAKWSTLTDRFHDFKKNVVLSSGNLSPDSNQFITAMTNCGLIANPKGVKDELDSLLSNLSKPHHSLPINLDRGIYIGGETVSTVTLAMCLLHMQNLGHCDLDITVIDELGNSICRLTNGQVICTAPTPPTPP